MAKKIKFRNKANLVTTILFLAFFTNSGMGQKLQVGDRAPDFEVITTTGDTIRLNKLIKQKIIVSFFRYVSCPVCNFRIHELIDSYDRIKESGYEIIAIFESNNTMLGEYLKDTQVPFAIIGDPSLVLYKKYGVEKSFWKTIGTVFKRKPKQAIKKGNKLFDNKKYKRDGNISRIPADFIINEKGIITTAYYGKNISDHLPLIEILNK